MKKLKQILEEWELSAALGISLKLGVSGFDALLLPLSTDRGLVAHNRLHEINEQRLGTDELLLSGKLAFKRLAEGATASAEELEEEAALFNQKKIEVKKQVKQVLPVSGAYSSMYLQVKAEAQIMEPVVLLMNSSLKGEQHLQINVKRGANARLLVFSQLDVHSAQYIKLLQEENSRVELVWIPLQTQKDSYLALHATLGEAAELRLHQPCLEDPVHILNTIELQGDRARVEQFCPLLALDGITQKIETTILHQGCKTYSRMHKHGVLGKASAGHFYGRHIIAAAALHTDAYQESRFLVLDPTAKAHTHPVLVIDGNELQAGHAASVAQIDEEQLYYLQSRGLTKELAQRLITAAFLRALIEEMDRPELRAKLLEIVLKKVDR